MGPKYLTEKSISIYALLISIVSIVITIVFSARGCKMETRLNKLHIDPSLDYYLIRSVDKESLEFHLKNRSPIPVVNLSVEHKYFVFFVNLEKYVMESPAMASILYSPGENWIFKQELGPNESVGKKDYQILAQFESLEGKTEIVIAAVFNVTFYRESDMKQFSNKAMFFLDSQKIYSYKNALDQEHLVEPIKQFPAFELKLQSTRKRTEIPSGGSRLYQKAD